MSRVKRLGNFERRRAVRIAVNPIIARLHNLLGEPVLQYEADSPRKIGKHSVCSTLGNAYKIPGLVGHFSKIGPEKSVAFMYKKYAVKIHISDAKYGFMLNCKTV